MDFHPTADQRELIADAFSRPLDDLLPIDRLHRDGQVEPWDALAELGIFGIALDPDRGGVGLSAVEEALLARGLGQKLASPQIIATLMAGHVAPTDLLESVATGQIRVAPAFVAGTALALVGAQGADHILIRSEGRTVLVPASAIGERSLLDDRHWTLPVESAALPADPIVWASDDATLRIRLIEAAALSGIAQAATDMAVAYAGLREQFGHPIGGFQAVKHHCANMAAATMAASDLTTFAATALAQRRDDAPFHVEAALLLAIDAALETSRKNVQVHGGMGFSDEADAHLLVKRAHLLIELAGGAEAATDRVAAAAPPMGH